ncbi:MAG: rhamnulokinase family protein [Candidatus Hydrogenedentota bacterium]
MAANKYLAIDLGAESGRAMVGSLDHGKLTVEELHRFPNGPIRILDTLYWDLPFIYSNVVESLRLYAQKHGPSVNGIGIDSWAVDHGLLDKDGDLLMNPVCYRDKRTEGMVEEIDAVCSVREMFERSGIPIVPIYTAVQLFALKRQKPHILDMAHRLLLMPDLLNYLLCGSRLTERTNAITTQLYDPRTRAWSEDVFGKLGLPRRIMTDLVDPGARLGELRPALKEETGLERAPIIAPCTHDTGSAMAAVPAANENYAAISCGTWSIVAMNSDKAHTSDEAYRANLCNELTLGGLFLCRNIMGLWLLQQTRAAWEKAGRAYSYGELEGMAQNAAAHSPLLNVNDGAFLAPKSMPDAIHAFCQRTGQETPASEGAMARCIVESLALSYREAIEHIQPLVGREVETVHIVGGGCRNTLLCQMTANAMQRPVLAGPADATAAGNLLTVAIGDGAIHTAQEVRDVVRNSVEVRRYEPEETGYWRQRFERYREIEVQTRAAV